MLHVWYCYCSAIDGEDFAVDNQNRGESISTVGSTTSVCVQGLVLDDDTPEATEDFMVKFTRRLDFQGPMCSLTVTYRIVDDDDAGWC